MTTFSKLIPVVLMLTAAQLSAGDSGEASDWPGWRGANSDAVVNDAGVMNFDGNRGLKIAWKKALGSGYSSVSISDGRAVTMFSDSAFDNVIALDAATGRELWRFKIDSTYKGHDGSHDGPISTPLVADGKVYVLGAKGHLIALNAATGKKVWSSHLVEDHDALEPLYGFATCPILYESTLIVETGGKGDNAVSGLNKDTGEVLWTAGTDTVQYQSPALFDFNGQTQVLCVGEKQMIGLNPATGEVLWQYGTGGRLGHMNPVVVGENRIFLHHQWSECKLVEIKKESGTFKVEDVWSSKNIKSTYNVPVYYDGHIYGYSGIFLTCLDAANGKSVWKSRSPGDGFMILVDGHLVITTKDGGLHVAKASPQGYGEVASLNLFDSNIWTPASFANSRIYARSLGEIAGIEIADVSQPAVIAHQPVIPQGTEFAGFVRKLKAAKNKSALIDEFMEKQKRFPIIEKDNYVHFVYRGEAEDMGIGSDLFGDRTEERMHRIPGTDFFFYSAQVEADAQVTYTFTRNFEQQMTDSLNTEKARTIWGEKSVLAMPAWSSPQHLKEPSGDKLGRIDSLKLESKIQDNTRRLDIYLPPGYGESSKRYPVAYVHWGNLAQSFGNYVNTLNNIIGKSVAPVIVVFIPPQGRGEFLGDRKDLYAQMVVEEVVPVIDSTFLTLASPENRASIGSGFAGFQAWYTTFKHPGVFGKAGGQSAFMLTEQENVLKPLIADAASQPLDIYLEWAHYDYRSEVEAWDTGQVCEQLAELLRQKGYAVGGGEVNQGYAWVCWRNHTDKMFEHLFPL